MKRWRKAQLGNIYHLQIDILQFLCQEDMYSQDHTNSMLFKQHPTGPTIFQAKDGQLFGLILALSQTMVLLLGNN